MFEDLKSNQHPFIKLVLWALIGLGTISFVFFGIVSGDRGLTVGGAAAEVDGSLITTRELSQMVERQKASRPNQADMNAQQLKMMEAQALESLIARKLLLSLAKDQGYRVADSQILGSLKEIPAFLENGRFSKTKYNMVLQANQLSAGQFEDMQREDILVGKVNQMIGMALQKSEAVKKKSEVIMKTKVNVDFVAVDSTALPHFASPTAGETQAFLANPENAKRVEDYYKTHKDQEFKLPEEIHARHILIRAVQNDEDSLKKAKDLADQAREKAKKEGFAAAVKAYSQDDLTKDRDGDLGFFRRGINGDSFDRAAFALKKGEISEPIQTTLGYQVVEVLERREATEVPFEKAKETVAAKLIQSEKSKTFADDFEKAIKANDKKSVEAEIQRAGLKWEETGPFSLENETIPKVGSSIDFQKVAFTLSPNSPLDKSYVREGGKIYLLKLKQAPQKDAAQNDQFASYFEQFMDQRRYQDSIMSLVDELKKEYSVKRYAPYDSLQTTSVE